MKRDVIVHGIDNILSYPKKGANMMNVMFFKYTISFQIVLSLYYVSNQIRRDN